MGAAPVRATGTFRGKGVSNCLRCPAAEDSVMGRLKGWNWGPAAMPAVLMPAAARARHDWARATDQAFELTGTAVAVSIDGRDYALYTNR